MKLPEEGKKTSKLYKYLSPLAELITLFWQTFLKAWMDIFSPLKWIVEKIKDRYGRIDIVCVLIAIFSIYLIEKLMPVDQSDITFRIILKISYFWGVIFAMGLSFAFLILMKKIEK